MDLQKNKNREDWVDILRGLSVYLVILGHLYAGYVYHLVVNPVKMPMFYFLAGYVMRPGKTIKEVFNNRLRTLFIPLFVFSLFPIRALYYLIVLKDMHTFSNYLLGFADGSINWFIYSFFVSSLLFAGICKACKENLWITGILSTLCFAVGILTKDVSYMSLWNINTAMTGVFYMFFGYVFHQLNPIKRYNKHLVLLCFLVYCILIYVSYKYFHGHAMNFHLCKYYNAPVALGLTGSGVYVLIHIAKWFCQKSQGRLKHYLTIFGQNTLVVYLFSSTTNAAVLMFYRNILKIKSPGFLLCVVGAAVSCVIGTVVSALCKKYAPFLLGLRRRK